MTKDEALKLALEALESAANNECNFYDYKYAAKALRQALEQPEQVSVPEGWKLVPIEPTDAMLSVPVNIDLRECVTPGGVTGLDAVGLFNAWEAMIEAAPQPWDTTDMAHRTGGLSMGQEHESRITALEIRVAKLEKPMTEHEKQLMAGQRSLLRTEPPKREWQGLTDEEALALVAYSHPLMNKLSVARAIEAKLKEKNG